MCYPIQWEEKGGGGGGDLSKVMQGHTAEATQDNWKSTSQKKHTARNNAQWVEGNITGPLFKLQLEYTKGLREEDLEGRGEYRQGET